MEFGTLTSKIATAAALSVILLAGVTPASAADAEQPPAQDWKFSGPFGRFDIPAIQRGLQVYLQVCSACHSLNQLAYRNLSEIGFNKEEIKAIAASHEVTDGPNDQGEMYQRPARPADKFVPPFPNAQAARVANNGALPPDLSLIAKATPAGPDFIYAILTGFAEAPADVKLAEGMNYNPYFPGKQIAMPPPLYEDSVEYADGTKATVQQMAWDVSNFLQWAAEPKMQERKTLGWKVVLFLLVLSAILYATKRKVWSKLH